MHRPLSAARLALPLGTWALPLLFWVLQATAAVAAPVAGDSFSLYVHPRALRNGSITGHYRLWINGRAVPADADTLSYLTHYPGLDTIYLGYGDAGRADATQILSRFRPAGCYAVVPACCDAPDIVPAEIAEDWVASFVDFDADPVLAAHRSLVPVQFQPLGKTDVPWVAVFVEPSGFPYGVSLAHARPRHGYRAQKGYYWSNFTSVAIGRLHDAGELQEADALGRIDDVLEDDYDRVLILHLRFFHGERVLLRYDPDTGRIGIRLRD